MTSMSEDELENKHFNACNVACLQYEVYIMEELTRRRRHLEKMPTKYREKLPIRAMEEKLGKLQEAVRVNQRFFEGVVQQNCPPKIYDQTYPTRTAPERHMSKVKTTIEQCVRDWAAEGKEERDAVYGPILGELQKFLPVTTPDMKNKQKVLIPGVGLGRLLLEVCMAGYSGQGNEFDYFMLYASDFFLNSGFSANSIDIFPWIHSPLNVVSGQDALRSVKCPDVSAIDCLKQNPGMSMSMSMGEFVEVYDTKENYGAWDSVVTCFFVDTAPNIAQYCELIQKLLRHGGVWVNLGPLLYHWYAFGANPDSFAGDPRYLESIELTYEELKFTMGSYGFEFLNEERRVCHYNRRPSGLNMKETVYNCILFTAKKT